jgi:hypothetical protein
MKEWNYSKNTIYRNKKYGETTEGDSLNRWLLLRRQLIGAFFYAPKYKNAGGDNLRLIIARYVSQKKLYIDLTT